jgi:hypothetical protein
MAIAAQPREQLLLTGIVGGIVAGVVFAMAEMVMSLAMGGPFLAPLQMIGAIALGPSVLPPAVATVSTVIVGLIVHMTLSAMYGVIFVYVLALGNQLNTSTGRLLLYGSIFGLALWVINFLLISQFIAFPWFFHGANQFWMGFIAHTFFFGTVIGGYVAAVRPRLVAPEGQ